MDSANIKNKIMNREDIQEDFRKQTGQPTMALNKCEVGTNPEYVIWLEKRILALTIPVVANRQGTVNLKPLEKIQERIDRLTKLKKEFEAYEDSDIIHKKELELLAERIKTLKWVVLN